jgi:hypothetical protein
LLHKTLTAGLPLHSDLVLKHGKLLFKHRERFKNNLLWSQSPSGLHSVLESRVSLRDFNGSLQAAVLRILNALIAKVALVSILNFHFLTQLIIPVDTSGALLNELLLLVGLQSFNLVLIKVDLG